METAAKHTNPFGLWRTRLADIFTSPRQRELERELAETRTRLELQKKHTERFRQRYDALDGRCSALDTEVGNLRLRLCTATRQADAFRQVIQATMTAAEPKQLYEMLSPFLDTDGFQLFHTAQELAGFRLYEKFPYEDNCGCFEFVDGFTQMRYLEAYQFGAVEWEIVSGSTYEKAKLREVDKSTAAYQEFERQLYPRVLERLGIHVCSPAMEQAEHTLAQGQQF